jgi:hypothetical protein
LSHLPKASPNFGSCNFLQGLNPTVGLSRFHSTLYYDFKKGLSGFPKDL